MNSRLQDDLNSFLIQYDLTTDSRIFEESLPHLAGVEDIDKKRLKKFKYVYSSQPGCVLTVPIKISDEDKLKLFTFCDAPLEVKPNKKDEHEENDEDSYESPCGQQLEIREAHLIEKIIPAFKSHIEKLANEGNNSLKPYQLFSKRILANKALKNIEYRCESLLALLNKGNDSISENEQALSLLLLQLKGLMSELSSENHHVYRYLANIIEKMEAYMSGSDMKAKLKINKEMSLLFQSLESYLRYNEVVACLRSENIFLDINKFLFDKKISIHDCDIFENTLLELAGVSEYGRCKVDQDYENARNLMISVGALSQENAGKFMQFLHECGAKSAVISYSCYQRTPIIHDGDSDDDGPYAVVQLPNVRFTIDNQEIANLVLPKFYQQITTLAKSDSSRLIPYQEKSKNSFKSNKSLLANNPAQLFHVNKEVKQDESELVQGNDLGKPTVSLSRSQ